MSPKHLAARIDQCLRNAELSRCPRRTFGAMLIDPKTNSIVSDGYNGPPRGEEGLCRGWFCERDGVEPSRLEITNKGEMLCYHDAEGRLLKHQSVEDPLGPRFRPPTGDPVRFTRDVVTSKESLFALREKLISGNPPIPSGTSLEKGCHHAELNALANAAKRGTPTDGTWLIVTGEPCTMCSKFLHHAGVAKVFVVRGGYAGGDAGPAYLRTYGVVVEYVEGPRDPRAPTT